MALDKKNLEQLLGESTFWNQAEAVLAQDPHNPEYTQGVAERLSKEYQFKIEPYLHKVAKSPLRIRADIADPKKGGALIEKTNSALMSYVHDNLDNVLEETKGGIEGIAVSMEMGKLAKAAEEGKENYGAMRKAMSSNYSSLHLATLDERELKYYYTRSYLPVQTELFLMSFNRKDEETGEVIRDEKKLREYVKSKYSGLKDDEKLQYSRVLASYVLSQKDKED